MSSMIKNCPHNDYPSLCSRCSIERHAGSHRKLLNDIEQARVESAEQVVVEGLRAKGLLDDEPFTPRAGERYGFVVFTGRFKVLDYHKANGQQMATADGEEEARTIVRALNTAEQHATLVEQRVRLVEALKNAVREIESLTESLEDFHGPSSRPNLILAEIKELLATIEREGV